MASIMAQSLFCSKYLSAPSMERLALRGNGPCNDTKQELSPEGPEPSMIPLPHRALQVHVFSGRPLHKASQAAEPHITTVMIRNIACAIKFGTAMQILDSWGMSETYDVLYLPMNSKKKRESGILLCELHQS